MKLRRLWIDGYKNLNDFEIENMYPIVRIKEAYINATTNISSNINKNSIEKEAKKALEERCKDFDDVDFEHFKKLFDCRDKSHSISHNFLQPV